MTSVWDDVKAAGLFLGEMKMAAATRQNVSEYGSALLVSCKGEVYALGKNKNGCLALGSEETREPKKIPIPRLSSVSGVSVCDQFGDALAYTREGKLYIWGANVYESAFRKTVLLQNLPNIIDAKCIGGHYLALSDNGKVYEWRGMRTIGPELKALNTRPVDIKLSETIVAIACGPLHSFAITKYGEVYSFGFIWCNKKLWRQPATKMPIQGETVAKVACGFEHSLALTHHGRIYTWGYNAWGLGDDAGNVKESYIPLQVGGDIGRFTDIATNGSRTNAAITETGSVYMWGLKEKGEAVRTLTLTQCTELHQVFSKVSSSTYAWTYQPSLCLSKDYSYFVAEEDSASLGIAMASTFNVEDFSDLTLLVGNKPIYVHKYVLQLRSEFFRTWLEERWTDKRTRRLELTSYSYDVYLSYVRYLYSGEVKTSSEHIIDLWDLAVAYREKNLKLCCEMLIEKNMRTKSLLSSKLRTMKPSVSEIRNSTSLEERINEIKADYESQSHTLKDEYMKSLQKLKNEYKVSQDKDASQFTRLSALLESQVLETELEANNDSTNPESVYSEKAEAQKDGEGGVGILETVDFEITEGFKSKREADGKPETSQLDIKGTNTKTYQSEIKQGYHKAGKDHLETEESTRKGKRSYEKLEEDYKKLMEMYRKQRKRLRLIKWYN